jgi:RHS repeat-associated protein
LKDNFDRTNQTVTFTLEEKHIFGSARLGVLNDSLPMLGSQNTAYNQTLWNHTVGKRTYELSNHLGNVLSVISDKVIPHQNGSTVDYFLADIRQSTDYSPFGVQLSGRNFVKSGAEEYAFGFQRQLEDDELKGEGNSLNFEYRMHDPRLGRFFAIDPLTAKYPWNSPYVFAENKLGLGVELEGLELESVESMMNPWNWFVWETNVAADEIYESVETYAKASVLVWGSGLALGFVFEAGVVVVVEEIAEEVFEEVTGVPVIVDPVDVLQQIYKKGGRTFAKEVLVEGRKFVSVERAKNWAFNVKVYGKKLAEKISKGEVTGKQAKLIKNNGFDDLQDSKTIRDWYKNKVSEIDINVEPTAANARKISEQRAKLKREAREMMADKEEVKNLNENFPVEDYQYYVNKYYKEGYRGEDLFKRIILGGTTTNKKVDEKFNIKP